MRNFFVVLIALMLSNVHAADAKMRITGTIMDMDTKKPVDKAEVVITIRGSNMTARGTSDANGQFQIEFPDFWPPGEHPLEIRCFGYYQVQGIVLVQDGAIRNFYMKSIPQKSPIELRPDLVINDTLPTKPVETPTPPLVKTDTPIVESKPEIKRPPTSNLVFLIDVSSSMNEEDRMSVVKVALTHLAGLLRPSDKVSIVTYSSTAKLYLPPSGADKRELIKNHIDSLKCDGTTMGGLGLDMAYKVARQNYIPGENNKVILITDGLFTSTDTKSYRSMEKLISKGYESKVALTVFSVGKVSQKVKDNLRKMSEMGGGTYAHLEDATMAKDEMVDEANNLGVFKK